MWCKAIHFFLYTCRYICVCCHADCTLSACSAGSDCFSNGDFVPLSLLVFASCLVPGTPVDWCFLVHIVPTLFSWLSWRCLEKLPWHYFQFSAHRNSETQYTSSVHHNMVLQVGVSQAAQWFFLLFASARWHSDYLIPHERKQYFMTFIKCWQCNRSFLINKEA